MHWTTQSPWLPHGWHGGWCRLIQIRWGRTGKAIAQHFNDASKHKSHGRRIDRDEAARTGVVVEHLEDDQKLQEAVLIMMLGTRRRRCSWSSAYPSGP